MKLTTLNLTWDRVLFQIIVPGLLASFPYLMLFFEQKPDILEFFLGDAKTLFVTFVALLSILPGMILENFGSIIEAHYYDRRHKKKDNKYMTTWKKFLQIAYDKEPIGHSYLRNILFRMKFELSVGCGLIFMTIGLGIYDYDHVIFKNSYLNLIIVYILPTVVSIYLIFIEGWKGSKVLHETRKLLVAKYYK
jgi:hypothetical protein